MRRTIIATAALALAACSGTAEPTSPDWAPDGYEPCPTEDAAGPCYWDAESMGNGDGDTSTFDGYSFLQHADGSFTRISPGAGIPLPTEIEVGK